MYFVMKGNHGREVEKEYQQRNIFSLYFAYLREFAVKMLFETCACGLGHLASFAHVGFHELYYMDDLRAIFRT